MAYELFLTEDVAVATTTVADADTQEFIALCDKLGLKNQRKFVVMAPNDAGTPSLIPYLALTPALSRCIDALAPEYTDLESFQQEQIPVRILAAAAECKEKGYFKEFGVRTTGPDQGDPFLLGFTESRYHGGAHLIGRWGEHLFPWGELYQRARTALITQWKAQLQAKLEECKAFSIESSVARYLTGAWVSTPF